MLNIEIKILSVAYVRDFSGFGNNKTPKLREVEDSDNFLNLLSDCMTFIQFQNGRHPKNEFCTLKFDR